jgi:DNA-binding beta-propeller fold protein YncE
MATHFLGITFLASMLWGCGSGENGVVAGPSVGFVITTDFSVGNLSTITTTPPRTTTPGVLGSVGIHSDSAIRTFANRVFIIQRLGSNSIVVIDPNQPSQPLTNYSTNDPGSNTQSDPHDMAFVSLSKAYVARYGQNTLLIVNPLTGQQLGTIDLSTFADSDGIVEMDRMIIVGNTLYVTLQRLDRNNAFSASNDSLVAVIDISADQIIDLNPVTPDLDAIVLQGRNPFGGFFYLSSTDRIYIANTGNFDPSDDFGGLEAINPNTNSTEGIIITDESLGGSLGLVGILNSTVAYATVFDANFNNLVVPFSISPKQVGVPLTGLGQGFKPGLAFDSNGFLYISDRDITNPGIQVFNTTTNQKVEGPMDTGLPPFEIAFVTP